jgi:hypothetical protein
VKRRRTFTVGRDTILFIAGLGLTVNEGFFRRVERPSLLVLYGAMMGLPAFLKADANRRTKKTGEVPVIKKKEEFPGSVEGEETSS